MSVSFSPSETFSLDTAIINALGSSSPLEIELLTAVGVSSAKIKKIYKQSISKSSQIEDNFKALSEWKKVHKKDKDRVTSVLSKIFQLEKPDKAKQEIELFLMAGGTMRQVREFLQQTESPETFENRILFIENVSLIAELEATRPDTQKTSKRSHSFFSGKEKNRKTEETTIEEFKQNLALEFATDTSLILTAAATGHDKLARMLIEKIYDTSEEKHTKHYQLFVNAMLDDNRDLFDELLQAGFDPNAMSSDSNTLLIFAITRNKFWAIPPLLKYGADPNKANNKGITPIHYAVNFGLTKEVELLVNQGADLNHQTAEGTTPLHRIKNIKSTPADKMQMWKLLINLGADPTIIDIYKGKKSNTPLSTILYWGEKELIKEVFKSYPVIVNIITSDTRENRIESIIESAAELLKPNSNSAHFLPMEIPFLLQNHKLASRMITLIPKRAAEAQIAEIRKKYPSVPLRILVEAAFESNSSYILKFGEVVANKVVSNAEYDTSLTVKTERLIVMLDKVLLKKDYPEGLKFEGESGYKRGPKYVDHIKKPGDPGYRNISMFKDANGKSFTPLELRAKMVSLVRDIKNRQSKPGTPSYEKSEELENWYRYLETTLCEIIDIIDLEDEYQASPEDPTPNAAALIEIALTGGNCGGWYMGEAQKIKQQKMQQEIGLHQQVFTVLSNLHERICQGFIDQNDEQNTHVMNLVYQVIDEHAGISNEQKKARFYFLDPIPAIDREGQSQIIKHGYWKDFNPSQIVDEVHQAINFEHTVNYETVIDWLKENTPADWKLETYDSLRNELSRAKSTEQKWSILQDKFAVAIKKPRPIKQQLFVHLLKNHHELFELYEKISMIAVSMQSMPLMAKKLIQERYEIALDPKTSFEKQLQDHFIKQLPQSDQQEYRTTLALINGHSYEESTAVLSERLEMTPDPLPNLERAIEQARAYDYISTVISEDGVISREAIVYMLTKIGVLQRINPEESHL